MRKIFTLLSLLTVFSVIKSQNATFLWKANGGGAEGADRSTDVVADPSGNIFTANTFLNTAAFNGVTHIGSAKGSGSNYDNSLFVSKIDSLTKTTLWSLYSNDGVINPVALATTSGGDLILVGTARAVTNTANQTTTANIIDGVGTITSFSGLSASKTQGFVAKFNSSGIIQWVKEINSDATKATEITTTSVAVDGSDNIYVSGTYASSVLFPGSSSAISSTNTTKAAYLLKLSGSDGTAQWNLVSSGGIVSEELSALAFGSDGYLYAGGIFRGATSVNVTLGGKTFTPSTGYDLTLLKIDASGNVQYIQNRVNSSDTRVKDIVVNGSIAYVSGSFRGDATGIAFSQGALTATAKFLNGFIASFSTTDGSDLWQKTVAAPAISEVDGLAVGADNRLYAFGYHYNALSTTVASGTVNFGDGVTLADTPTSNKLGDLFLSGYNLTTGKTLEVHLTASGTGSETANALTASGNKLYFVGSSNSSPATFENSQTYSTLGTFDFFVGAYSLPLETLGINSTKSTSSSFSAHYNRENKSIEVTSAEVLTQITIRNIEGKTVYSANLNSESSTIEVNLNSGVYVIQGVDQKGNTAVQKLLIP